MQLYKRRADIIADIINFFVWNFIDLQKKFGVFRLRPMLNISVTNAAVADKVAAFVEEKTHLFHKNISVNVVNAIRRNEAGKVILQ